MQILWTDGSAKPNPGHGGWAVIDAKTKQPVKTGADRYTTNIRMEATAIKEAIKYAATKNEPVEIHTDSEFWINVLEKWAPTWKRNNWTKRTGKIKNLDLVKELYQLYQDNDVTLIWEKGHAGLELNELADLAAKSAARHPRPQNLI